MSTSGRCFHTLAVSTTSIWHAPDYRGLGHNTDEVVGSSALIDALTARHVFKLERPCLRQSFRRVGEEKVIPRFSPDFRMGDDSRSFPGSGADDHQVARLQSSDMERQTVVPVISRAGRFPPELHGDYDFVAFVGLHAVQGGTSPKPVRRAGFPGCFCHRTTRVMGNPRFKSSINCLSISTPMTRIRAWQSSGPGSHEPQSEYRLFHVSLSPAVLCIAS